MGQTISEVAIRMATRALGYDGGLLCTAGPLIHSDDREGLYAFLMRDPAERTIHIILITCVRGEIFDMEFINDDEEDDDEPCEIDMFFVDDEGTVIVECSNRLQGRAHIDGDGNLRKIPVCVW
ncbi:MAG: hypothetical protein HGA67_01520 [Candidatus Yonathbacteria bacterium]|nr:hypothetical protein [Candidatus Yonathbacteria bacterium]